MTQGRKTYKKNRKAQPQKNRLKNSTTLKYYTQIA